MQILMDRRVSILAYIGLGVAVIGTTVYAIRAHKARAWAEEAQHQADINQDATNRAIAAATEAQTARLALSAQNKAMQAELDTLAAQRKPVPPVPGKPPTNLYGQLGTMGLRLPAQLDPKDAVTVWGWGQEAQNAPQLRDAIAEREYELAQAKKLADGYKNEATAAEEESYHFQTAYGEQLAATKATQASLDATRKLVHRKSAGVVFRTDGAKGLYFHYDCNVFRLGVEATQQPIRGTEAAASVGIVW